MKNLWHKLFLCERPSISLAFFRLAAALTVGFHVLPTFFPLKENYLSGAFKVLNSNFFTPGVLQAVQGSPDSFVVLMVWIFCAAWFCFLIGLWTQVSCIVMTLGCYYFYALNAFAIGTLSWDILLVTLFLLCLTPYLGDYLSVDCLLKGQRNAYQRQRPYFLQRLLQIQIALTYFYTGLYKITAEGNWLTANPIYDLLLSPDAGVTKYFLLRDFFVAHPGLCYVLGVLIVTIELLMPFLLFNRSTRTTGITLGFIFHITLILTLDVPAIFFFLFPAQLLLFVAPEQVIAWIHRQQAIYKSAPAVKVIYDGDCQFCSASVEKIKIMDLFGRLTFINYHAVDVTVIHSGLTKEKAHSQFHLLDTNGELYGGFFAFRRMTWLLPMLYPSVLVFYFPGASIIGPLVYAFIAKNRYLFHFNKKCTNNACLR